MLGGFSQWTLGGTNTTGAGGLWIGDGTTFSGNNVGGTVSVANQNNLGGGAVAVNYGGTLTLSASFNPSNTITVNGGGTYTMNGNNANAGVTVSSLGTLAGANNAFAGTLPTAGALLVNAAITATKDGGITPSGTNGVNLTRKPM